MPLLKLNGKLAEALGKKQEVKAGEHSLLEMTETLAGIGDEGWGKYAFYHEILEGKFSDEEKRAYIAAANSCGREEARFLRMKYPEETAEEIAVLLGLKVLKRDTPAGGGHVIFAQYEEPDKITVYTDASERGSEILKSGQVSDRIRSCPVKEVLTAHELFHAIEYRKQSEIYTQTERVELWKKPFSNRSRIRCLSEIAAMAFAGELLHLEYSPFLMDVLLIYAYNPGAAAALFEEICSAADIPVSQKAQ